MYRVVDFIADFLESKGLNTLFTVTGGGSIFINDAFSTRENWNCIANHNEQASSYAAEGYSRISGKPGICVVTSGPGGTNAITGVLCSYQDSIPVFYISGNVRKELTTNYTGLNLRQLGDQECNIINLVKPITKKAIQLNETSNLLGVLEELYSECVSGRPGPIWLDIPLDIQKQEVPEFKASKTPVKKNNEEKPDLLNIKKEIAKSKRPLFLFGNGIRLSGAQDILKEFLANYPIPFVTSFNAIDLIESDHPLNFGRIGILGQIRSNKIVQQCDLLIVIGSRLYVRQVGYNKESFAKNAKIIHIDIDEGELNKPTISSEIKLNMCAHVFLREMISLKNMMPTPWREWIEECKKVSEYNPIILDRHFNNKPMNPYGFLYAFSMELDKKFSYILSDGTANVAGSQVIILKEGQRLFTNKATAPMGYGLPAAIGASYSYNNIVCIEGDGSIQMNIQELQTLKDSKKNIVVVIINNNGYLSIKTTQNNLCGGRLHLSNPLSGLRLPSYEKLSKAYGIRYVKIDSFDKISSLVKTVNRNDGPLIVEVFVNENDLHEPKIVTKMNDKGEFTNPDFGDIEWLA